MPESALLYLYVETSLHAGGEPTPEGEVDLPIQREESTGYPVVRASTLKGRLRSMARASGAPAEEIEALFGSAPEAPEDQTFSGSVLFGEARLLLFPVRSLAGVFGWTTSSLPLAHLRRDALSRGLALPWGEFPAPAAGTVMVAPDSGLRNPKGQVVLEEVAFRAEPKPEVAVLARWLAAEVLPAGPESAYWAEKLQRDLALLPEDAFRFFATHSTEVVQRIRIDGRTGAAAEGALWSEEYLPADTVLWSPLDAEQPVRPAGSLQSGGDALRWLRSRVPPVFQIGGNRTLGRGFVRPRWVAKEATP